MALTIEEIDAYNTQGFVLIKDVLSPSDTKPVIDEFGAFIDSQARELYDQDKITDLHADAPFDMRYGLLLKQCA